jgi:acetoin utilization protein AcuB
MRVEDVMTTNVVTIDPETLVNDATKIMDAHRIRRLPVVKRGKLVGLVTKHMLLEAAPSPATSLSIWELHHLLSKLKVREVMTKRPLTISPEMSAEEALQLGREKGYGAFPVTDNGDLVGIVTESDIVGLMTRVLGVEERGKRIDLKVPREFHHMHKVIEILDKKGCDLLSFFTYQQPGEEDYLMVLRLANGASAKVAGELSEVGFEVSYVG